MIPVPAVIVALSSEKHRYRIIRFPPHVCTTDELMWFYSTTVPFTFLIGTGVSLLITILCEVHRVSCLLVCLTNHYLKIL